MFWMDEVWASKQTRVTSNMTYVDWSARMLAGKHMTYRHVCEMEKVHVMVLLG